MTPTPTLSIEISDEGEGYVLMATSYSSTEPAGERLFRSRPWPDIKFKHATLADAERDIATLQTYLNEVHSGKARKGKRGAEEEGVVVVAAPDIEGAWWK